MTPFARPLAFVAAWLLAACAALPPPPQETVMPTHHSTGPFEVAFAPQPLSDVAASAGLGRMSLDKHFHGELEAASQGEMLSWRDAAKTSGGYVALELVRGALGGREGSFVLQHSSTMSGGVPQQSITVVPGSGTGGLAGLSGRMEVVIAAGGAHSYVFDWSLPD